jgi:hypothetical protein
MFRFSSLAEEHDGVLMTDEVQTIKEIAVGRWSEESVAKNEAPPPDHLPVLSRFTTAAGPSSSPEWVLRRRRRATFSRAERLKQGCLTWACERT